MMGIFDFTPIKYSPKKIGIQLRDFQYTVKCRKRKHKCCLLQVVNVCVTITTVQYLFFTSAKIS